MHVTGIIKAKGLSIVLLNNHKRHCKILFLLFVLKQATWKRMDWKNSATELLPCPSYKVWCASVVYFSSAAHPTMGKANWQEKWPAVGKKRGMGGSIDFSQWRMLVYIP